MPVIMLLRRSRIYKYSGELAYEPLINFATETYHEAQHQDKMPLIPTFWDEIKHLWNEEIKLKGGVVNTLLMKDSNGYTNWGALLLVYGLPIITVVIFYYMMKLHFTDYQERERLEYLTEKNKRTKQHMQDWLNKHANFKRKIRKWD